MVSSFYDLRDKDVVNIKDGVKLGEVCDLEFDGESAQITAIVLFGKLKFFGLLGREPDIVIKWEEIQTIGKDTVLVDYLEKPEIRKKKGVLLDKFFG